jgi:peptidoglycan hydrolase-like protein with peptidoglycan-binding domain
MAPGAPGSAQSTTFNDLQRALKTLGDRITVAFDYGPETREVVTSFQMNAGNHADGIAGAQMETKLPTKLTRGDRFCEESLSPRGLKQPTDPKNGRRAVRMVSVRGVSPACTT